MEFLREPHNGSWVAAQERYFPSTLEDAITYFKAKMEKVDVWFIDLDDNLAPSPAKLIARKAMGTSKYNPAYLRWVVGTASALYREGKDCETEQWRIYVDTFLSNSKALAEVRGYFTPERAEAMLYPGVKEWMSMLSGDKVLVTRNIPQVADAFVKVLNMRTAICRANDKEKAVTELLRRHPDLTLFGVDGDSEEDRDMMFAVQEYRTHAGDKTQRGILSIYSMDRPDWNKMDHCFDYATSKDRTALVELLS